MKRDKKGKITVKGDDNRVYQFTITFHSIINIIFWILNIIIILSPYVLKFLPFPYFWFYFLTKSLIFDDSKNIILTPRYILND